MKYGRGDGGGLEPIVSTDAVRMLSVVMWIACIVLYCTAQYGMHGPRQKNGER